MANTMHETAMAISVGMAMAGASSTDGGPTGNKCDKKVIKEMRLS